MSKTTSDLIQKSCKACEGGLQALLPQEIAHLLAELDGWVQIDKEITKTYSFGDYYETMAFVNALAWISHQEDHHPDLEVSFRKCRVRYSTHAIDGLSENDFICAAKTDQLVNPTTDQR